MHCSGKHYLIRSKHICLLAISKFWAPQRILLILPWILQHLLKLVCILFIKNNYYMLSNMEELHSICSECPKYYLCVKGALLLINSLAQINSIKVPRIYMPKYKESKGRSSLLKNAKLLSTCPPRTHLFRTNSWSEGCSSDNTSENTLVIHPQWLTAHRIFLLWGKGEGGLIPSAVSHRWIKRCAFSLVQAAIIWSIYKIKITCMKPGYLHFCISYPTL